FPLVYAELRALAHRQRQRWHGDETLGTTALVHEAYLKLVGQQRLGARSRAHFLAIAAKAMRHILSNYAEARRRLKRGGDLQRVSADALDAVPAPAGITDAQAEMLAALDDALRRLDETNARLSRVVECRFLAGLSIKDTAAALDTSPATVKRRWIRARVAVPGAPGASRGVSGGPTRTMSRARRPLSRRERAGSCPSRCAAPRRAPRPGTRARTRRASGPPRGRPPRPRRAPPSPPPA